MDLAHEIILHLLKGELHKAPLVSNPKHILDVGTGTGIWAIDMASKYPTAQVLGIDLRSVDMICF
jgi:methylase of polypeptide subunit release factors